MRRADSERHAALPEGQPAVDEVLSKVSLQQEVVAALVGLEPLYRAPMLLRYFEDLKPAAIGRRIGVPVETVKTRLKRGTELLRERLVGARGTSLREMAVALLPLLDRTVSSDLHRCLSASTRRVTTATTGAAATSAAAGLLGATLMSAKMKLGVAALLVAVSAFAVLKFTPQAPAPIPSTGSAALGRGMPSAPARAHEAMPPAAAEATRIAEPTPPVRADPASWPTAFNVLIEGIVRTEEGQPAKGALVAVAIVNDKPVFDSLIDVCRGTDWFIGPEVEESNGARTTTDDHGRFRIDRLASASAVDIAVAHAEEGLAVACGLALDPQQLPARVELTLTRGVVLHGSVRDEDGHGVSRATIALTGELGSSRWGIDAIKADEDGEFRSLPLPFTGFLLTAKTPGFIIEDRVVVPEPNARDARVDLTLARARTLVGRVVALDGGSAVLSRFGEALEVAGSGDDPGSGGGRAQWGSWKWKRGTVFCEQDKYEIEYSDRAMKYVSLWSGETLLGAAQILDPDHAPDLPVDLRRLDSSPILGSLVIDVIDAPTRAPVADFTVVVARTASYLLGTESRSERAVRESKGSLTISELEVGEYELRVHADGYARELAVARLSREIPSTAVLVALDRPSERLRGRTLASDGRPVPRVAIAARRLDGKAQLMSPDARATADDAGSFIIRDLAPGDYSVVAEAEGFAPSCVRTRGGSENVVLTLDRGAVVTFHLQRLGGPFEGAYDYRVRNEEGIPVIDLSGFNGGAARSVRLLPGRYTAEFFAAGHRCEPVPFTVTSEVGVPIEIVPQPEAR